MTGPEHYQRAEYLIMSAEQKYALPAVVSSRHLPRHEDADSLGPAEMMAAAQVHAMLALAAATALAQDTSLGDHSAWRRVAGVE